MINEMINDVFEDLYHLLREQASSWQNWRKTGNKDYLDSFFQITKMVIRDCLVAGLFEATLSNVHRCVETTIAVGATQLHLSLTDIRNWDDKYRKVIALDGAFREVATEAMELFKKASALFHASIVDEGEVHSALEAFKECASSAEHNPYARQLYCQALHECGDVYRTLGISADGQKRKDFLQMSLQYYDKCIAACKDEFQDSIVADSLTGKGRTLIEICPLKNEKDIRALFGHAYDLYKTARDRVDKIRTLQDYLTMLDDRIKTQESSC